MNDQGGVIAAASWPGAGQPMQKLQYDGRLGALYWIFAKNVLLNIITLTIYRFWGKTNVRRYAWSHTSLQGERFEYTGRGGELFVGFLIVVLFYAIGILVFQVLSFGMGEAGQQLQQVVVGFLILYLVFVAQYAAQNYRLTRTLWSGISGGMTGSAWKYGVKAFFFMLLNILTLNLATPWTTLRLAEDRFNNSYFGNTKASLQASSKPLYLSFILGFVCSIIGVVLVAFLAAGVAYALVIAFDLQPLLQEWLSVDKAEMELVLTDEQKGHATIILFVAILIFYVGAGLVSTVAFAPYTAALFRTIANNLQLAELRFSSEVTAWRYISLWVGNIFIAVLTLGIGLPIAVHRSVRFFADRVTIHGQLDVERLQQSSLERPRFGEGLLEAFDPGLI